MLRVTLADLTHEEPHHYILLLHQREEKRILGIWTSFREGPMIAWQAAGQPWVWYGPRRPLTFDVATRALKETGIFLQDVQITSVQDDVYYAAARVRSPAGDFEVDARPSDAIALALALERPIYVDPEVIRTSAWPQEELFPNDRPMGNNIEVIGDSLRAIWADDDNGVFANCLATSTADLPTDAEHRTWLPVQVADVLVKDGEVNGTIALMDDERRTVLPVLATNWDAGMLGWILAGTPWSQEGPVRPQTFQFLRNLFSLTGITLETVQISGPRHGSLRAALHFVYDGQRIRLDSRPVDAISLAYEMQAPIAVRSDLWLAGGVPQEALFSSKAVIGQGIETLVQLMSAPRSGRRSLLQKIGRLFQR